MENEEVLVSVFCLAYNHEKFIRETMEGFLMQRTDFGFEVLIHEDASTDGTADILRYYESMYPDKIRVVYEDINRYKTGVDYFYDILLPLSKGKYIACCEGDDAWIDEDKLQLQVDYMEAHPDCTLIGHKAYLQYPYTWDKVRDHRAMGYRYEGVVPYEDIFQKWEIPTSSFLFRKSTYVKMPKFFMEAPTGDEPLEFYLAGEGYIYFLNRVMSVYNKMASDSWTVKFLESGFDRMAHYYGGYIKLFKDIDAYTGYKRHEFFEDCIRERIRRAVVYILFNSVNQRQAAGMLKVLADACSEEWREYIMDQLKCFWFWDSVSSADFWKGAKDKTVYLYGAGALATKFINEIIPDDLPLKGIIVSDGKKKDDKLKGYDVMYLSDVAARLEQDAFIVIAVIDVWAAEIISRLEEMKVQNIVWIYESVFCPRTADSYYRSDKAEQTEGEL